MTRYYALNTYFRQKFGHRVQKIPLDAGASCPNRDGTLSRTGCIFCNPYGSGTGLGQAGLPLAAQYQHFHTRYKSRWADARFLGYLQSFSNTYGPISRLEQLLEECATLPDLLGIAIGTRPDCLDTQKITLLSQTKWPEVWLDLGIQSMHPQTLTRINRHHSVQDFVLATENAAKAGLFICAHLIIGLPGEHLRHFQASIRALNMLPIHGIKFHNLLVCRGTMLAQAWKRGEFTPLSREETLLWMQEGLGLLRPDIVVHRMNTDPDENELLAPAWAAQKGTLLTDFYSQLHDYNIWQGKYWKKTPQPDHPAIPLPPPFS